MLRTQVAVLALMLIASGSPAFAQGDAAPPGFTRMTSGAVKIDPLTIQIAKTGYGSVDAELTRIEQYVNAKLEKIREGLNYYVENTLDPTLQLKNRDSDALNADPKLIEALEKQYKQAMDEADKLFKKAKQESDAAFGLCPPPPPGAGCPPQKPSVLASIDGAEQKVRSIIETWKTENEGAVKNPRGYSSPDAQFNAGRTWESAIQELKTKTNDEGTGEGDRDLDDSSKKFSPELENVQQKGAPDSQQ